jgi:hypothetical protein
MSELMQFDPEFAAPPDWAQAYRDLGLQVVPAHTPRDGGKSWKRPALPQWRALEHELAPDLTFQRWYGAEGEHVRRSNMGIITGPCSGGVFVVDVDLQKNDSARHWWEGVLALHNHGGDLETPSQTTGGGGKQYLFRAPSHWNAPTFKTSVGVDVRGAGGFAMMPPSQHESGAYYKWDEGFSPWEVEILDAPAWLCEEIDRLAEEHGGRVSSSGGEKTPTPPHSKTPFGRIIDGREDYATRLVWARVVEEYRSAPIPLVASEIERVATEIYNTYERNVESRLKVPGMSRGDLLEREGRGYTMVQSKTFSAFRQWETKVREHAQQEPPGGRQENPTPDKYQEATTLKFDASTGEITREAAADTYETLDIVTIKTLPDPKYLIDKLIIERAMGFIFGAPGCGKTFIALDIAMSIAGAVKEWWSRRIYKTGPVVYISSEGVGDLKNRIRAWEVEQQTISDQFPFFLIRQNINFMSEADVERLLRTVAKLTTEHGAPVAVFVDTVSRVLPGADENLQKDMTLFIRACDAVREAFDTAVIGVHHTSRQGNMRGSTVFDGAGDFLLEVKREEGEWTGEIVARKIKSAQDGWHTPFELVRKPISDTIGGESLIARPLSEDKKPKNKLPEKETLRRILDEMRQAWIDKNPWTLSTHGRAKARSAIVMMQVRYSVPEKIAQFLVDQWLTNEVIKEGLCDTHTKRMGIQVIGGID